MPPPPPNPPPADLHPPIVIPPIHNLHISIMNNQGGDPNAQPQAPIQKASATVDIGKFRHGSDDFDEWVLMLESAIRLATNATGANHSELCKQWLPFEA